MNAEEIVKALRCCNRSKGHRCSECPVFSRYEHRICKATVDRFAADLIESLQAQLAASQRREQAAVEDIHEIDRFNGKCFRCKSWNGVRCKRGYSVNASFCNDWQWRGPQAGKGAEHD